MDYITCNLRITNTRFSTQKQLDPTSNDNNDNNDDNNNNVKMVT